MEFDGLSKQEIINKMGHMFMVANTCIINHNLDHVEIVDLLTTSFFGTFCGGWEKYLTEDSRESIKKAVKKDDDGLPIFDERNCQGILDGVNTLIYTIIKHFVGTPNISSRISDYLNNLRCPTMSYYRWYQDVFTLVKISFSSLNYYKSSFFVPKVSKVLFSSLNFSKHTDFHPSVYFR